MLAERTKRIGVSPTMKVAAEALKLKAQGVDVVDFGAGEPDFPTPKHIGAAAHAAIDANFTKYTTNSGTDELKRAVCARYKIDYGIEYSPKDMRLGMIEASNEKLGNVADRLLLYCYHYDPMTGKYGALVMRMVRIGGILTMVVLGGFIVLSVRRERHA